MAYILYKVSNLDIVNYIYLVVTTNDSNKDFHIIKS